VKFLTKLFYLFLIFSWFSNLSAQSRPEFVHLKTYFRWIESHHDVIFSYADEELNFVLIQYKKKFEDINDQLNFLRSQTPFKYIRQKDKSILVVPLNFPDEICLKVYDEITLKMVPGAILKNGNYYYSNNENAEFYIPLNSKIKKVKIYADDFATKEYLIDHDEDIDCLEIPLSPFYQALNEVVLSNLFTKGIQKIASGGLEINYEEFGLLPGLVEPDVLQSLQALPGIISPQESVSFLNVRGGTHDQNLFLWDGIKMYSTSHFFGMISAFNPYTTDKVRLVKNGTSAKYGDGVSSLIDMKTGNKIADSLDTSFGINFINADVLLKVPLGKSSSIELSSRHSINSLWESPTYNRYFDKVFQNTEVTNFDNPASQQNNNFSFFDATLSYKHRLSDKDFLKVNLLYAEDDFSLNRFDSGDESTRIRRSNLDKINLAGGLIYEREWTKSTFSQIQFYTSSYQLDALNADILNQQTLEQKNQVNEVGVKINFETQFSRKFGLESGFQFNETGILNSQRIDDPEFFNENQNSILSNSIYSQINYQSDNKLLNLNVGGRINHYSEFNEIVAEPRLSLSYQFLPDLFLEVLAEEKSQVTSQTIDLQTDFLGVENRRWVLSNPDSRPVIESQQFSAGINFIKPEWFINLDFYYKKVEGITTQGQGFQNQFEFAEDHGSYEVKGFDILINKNFEPFSGWASYSLSENTYTFSNLSPSVFHNNLDIRHVISTGLSFEKDGLKISAGFNWHSGVPVTLISENQDNLPQGIQYQNPNTARLNDYFRLDISSTYSFKLFKNVKSIAGLSFLNLLNNDNVYNQFYLLDPDQNIQTFRQNGLEFTPNLMLRINF
jgi:hypothetical protein